MIPERNKEIFIETIAAGFSFEQACIASHISRPTAFRFLKSDPIFKKKYDDSLFAVREKMRLEEDSKNMEELKRMVLKRKK